MVLIAASLITSMASSLIQLVAPSLVNDEKEKDKKADFFHY